MNILDGAKARLKGVVSDAGAWLKAPKLPDWWRRQDRSAERAAVATRATPFLASLYGALALTAWFLEFGFATLWALLANGEIDWTWRIDLAGTGWAFLFSAHLLPAILTTMAVAVIVAISVTWIPVYNGLAGMGRLRRGSVLVVGPLCTAIAIMGAIVVQVENVSDDARDAAVVQQQAGQDRASIERQIARIDNELAQATDQGRVGRYAAIAATVGEDAYRRDYLNAEVLAAEDASRRLILQRALGSATAADALRRQRAEAEEALRTAPTEASLTETTSAVETDYILGLVQWASDNRVVLIGVTLSLIGLFGLWQAQGLREAHALLNPDAPRQEAEDALARAREEAEIETIGAAPPPAPADEPAIGELDLPPLPDLRGVEDPAFDGLNATVDEEGRVVRRFAGWRAPPKARNDKRRAPEPDEDTMAMADIEDAPAGGDDAGDTDIDDAARWMREHAQTQAAEGERAQ